MTERLYYHDAYLADFDAHVVERADDGRKLYLDRTAFYPTSGGQPHDLGTIAGVAVEDVVDEAHRIGHVVAAPVLTDDVHCAIDWPRRFDFMQQHTGQHLLSAIFADCFGAQTVSVHFGLESSTLDLSSESVSEEHLWQVERRANEAIWANHPVTLSFEDAALATSLRKAAAREGTLRIVSIEGLDRSACGGTHVRGTGEIGIVLLRRQEKVRRTVRIEFVCGWRAVGRARRDFELLTNIAEHFSASIDDIFTLVESRSSELRALQGRTRRLENDLYAYRAREQYDAIVPDDRGLRRIVERHSTGTPDEDRAFALAFCALPGTAFAAVSDIPTAILFATSEDSGIDAGRTLKEALTPVGGRGGGSPRMAQGSVPSTDALAAVLRAIGMSA